MKTEFLDVNDTRKNVRVEIPKEQVDAEIDRVAKVVPVHGEAHAQPDW